MEQETVENIKIDKNELNEESKDKHSMLKTIERNIYEGMNCRTITAISNEKKNMRIDLEKDQKIQDEAYKK